MSLLRDALHLHFVAARDAEIRRARQQQQGSAVATAAAALQAINRHKEKRRDVAFRCLHIFGYTCSGVLLGNVP